MAQFRLSKTLLHQKHYTKALKVLQEVLEAFSRMNDQNTVAMALHAVGVAHQQSDQMDKAEKAYNQSLLISSRIGDQRVQAGTLHQLGSLYHSDPQRIEQSIVLYKLAADIFCQIGDSLSEGLVITNQAEALLNIRQLDAARTAINRAIECKKQLGHEAIIWNCWSILADIEIAANNRLAAANARYQSIETFLSYRRYGGVNHSGSGQLAQAVYQILTSGDPANAASVLQQLAADPRSAHLRPFLSALQAITAGSRDPSLAEDPGLHYSEAAEVVLLIEALEGRASS